MSNASDARVEARRAACDAQTRCLGVDTGTCAALPQHRGGGAVSCGSEALDPHGRGRGFLQFCNTVLWILVPGMCTRPSPALYPPPPLHDFALMPDCGVHYLWFAFVCFLIRSHPPGVFSSRQAAGCSFRPCR